MNKKGMSLIEMVVAILVISIASVILFSGFATVLRVMGEANTNKNNSDKLLSYAERSDNGTLRSAVTSEKVPNQYDLKTKAGNIITVKGSYHLLNIKGNKDITLKVLYNDIIKLVKEMPNYDSAISNAQLIKRYTDELAKEFQANDNWKQKPMNDSITINMLRKLSDEWPIIEKELLPTQEALYLKVCYPWDYSPSTGIEMIHDQPLLYLSKDSSDIAPTSQKDTIHYIYDYDSSHWYYYEGDKYVLDFKKLERGQTSMSVNDDNNPFGSSPLSWEKFMNHILEKNSGWRILDVNANYNEADPLSMWKLI